MKGDMSDKATPISCCCEDGNDLNGRLKYIAVFHLDIGLVLIGQQWLLQDIGSAVSRYWVRNWMV